MWFIWRCGLRPQAALIYVVISVEAQWISGDRVVWWRIAGGWRQQRSESREARRMRPLIWSMGTCEPIATGNLDTGEWPSRKQWQWVPGSQRRQPRGGLCGGRRRQRAGSPGRPDFLYNCSSSGLGEEGPVRQFFLNQIVFQIKEQGSGRAALFVPDL